MRPEIPNQEQNLLFHLHIPKTGGTSLASVLSEAVHPGRWHVALSEQALRERTTGYALLAGHFTWDKLAMFPEHPRVLTVLRDPVEQALSAYGYWRAHADEGIFNAETQIGADEAVAHKFEELLLNPSSRMRANLGMMTKYLAGVDELAAGRGPEAAMRHLESCAWVGTTTTLDRDVKVLPAMLGLKPITGAPRLMVTPTRPQRVDVSKEALSLLEKLTEPDRILYDRARAMAEEQQRLYA